MKDLDDTPGPDPGRRDIHPPELAAHERSRISDVRTVEPLGDGGLCRAVEQGPLDAEEEQYLVDLASLDAGRAVLKR